MADQDRWTDRHDQGRDRGRYAQEDRFRRGLSDREAADRRGYDRGYSEAYGDYGRSFDRDRESDPGADRAYGAGYGIDEERYGQGRQDHARQGEGWMGEGGYGDRRYGGRWGQGPEGPAGAAYPEARYGGSGGGSDRTWMERAGERVASFFGGGEVERGHRGRGPKNYTRSDERIREDVNDRLTDDPFVDASEIEVQVSGGEVTLSGTATRRADRRRAEDLAEEVSGVRHVQNNIRVQPEDPGASLPFPLA